MAKRLRRKSLPTQLIADYIYGAMLARSGSAATGRLMYITVAKKIEKDGLFASYYAFEEALDLLCHWKWIEKVISEGRITEYKLSEMGLAIWFAMYREDPEFDKDLIRIYRRTIKRRDREFQERLHNKVSQP